MMRRFFDRKAITRVQTAIIVLIIVVAVIAGAYYYTLPPAPSPTPTPEQVLTVSCPGDVDYLDPHHAIMTEFERRGSVIFDTLVTYDEDWNYQPLLAKSWEVSEDGLVWTFHLRDDVKFHCGHEFDAAAVKYTVERILAEETASPCASDLADVDYVEVVDKYTVAYHLKAPFAYLLDYLATPYHAPICPVCAEKWGLEGFNFHPCGTGPFKFAEWIPDDRIVLVKNEEYNWAPEFTGHEGPPILDKIIFRVIPESTTAAGELRTGGNDMIMEVVPAMMSTLEADPNIEILKCVAFSVRAIDINVQKPPTDDVKVRLAIAYAIDREELVEVYYGLADPAYSVLTPMHHGYDEDIMDYAPKYDIAKANELLEEAGWKLGADGIRYKDGNPLTLDLWTSDLEIEVDVSEVVQSQLKKIGIDAKITVADEETVTAAVTEGKQNIDITGYDWHVPDILLWFFHSSQIGYVNYAHYTDPEADSLLENMRSHPDPEVQYEATITIQRKLATEAVWVPYGYEYTVYALGAWVKGFKLLPYPCIESWIWLDVSTQPELKP